MAFQQADQSYCVGNNWVSGAKADVHLLDYRKLAVFLGIEKKGLGQSRQKTIRLLRGNTYYAFMYNIVMIGLASCGLMQPWVACITMAVSSLLMLHRGLSVRSFFSGRLSQLPWTQVNTSAINMNGKKSFFSMVNDRVLRPLNNSAQKNTNNI